MSCTRLQAVFVFLASIVCSLRLVNCSSLDKRLFSFNATPNFVKNVSRARLWTPYSTIAHQLDSNASTTVTTLSTFQQKTWTDPSSRPVASNDGNDETEYEERQTKAKSMLPRSNPTEEAAPRQGPIISSIRHYKSRKSFSRSVKVSDSDSARRPQPSQQRTSEPTSTSASTSLYNENDLQAKDSPDEDYAGDQGSISRDKSQNDRTEVDHSDSERKDRLKPISPTDTHIYGSPATTFDSRNRTKTGKKLNRIISLLSSVNATVPQYSPNHAIPNSNSTKSKGRSAALRKSKHKSNILGPSLTPVVVGSTIDLKSSELSPGSKNSERQQRLPVSTLRRSDPPPPSNNNVKSSNHYENDDDEIPLVFVPGPVPSFGENEQSSYEEELEDDINTSDKKELSPVNDYESPATSDDLSEGQGQLPAETESEPREDMDILTKFLRMVEEKTADNCAAGMDLTLGQGVVDRYAQERFKDEAEVAVNRANMLTRLWKYAPEVMSSEYWLHASVFSMVEFYDNIFAAGNCFDEKQYKNYTLFCPFAFRRPDGIIWVKDLAVEYKYSTNTSEFFYAARTNAERLIKNFNQFSRGFHSYTINDNHTEMTEEIILNVTYQDGRWSKPYFDCGGGNIWMMTYAVPFFDFKNNTYIFKGTSGIDIDLRRVDIDQCPLPENSTELNIFAASDKCKSATTKCVPVKRLGFRRGSYHCVCKDGFYFPNVTSQLKYFNGSLLEEEYENKFMGRPSRYSEPGAFECLLCPYGCDNCVDDKPCVVSLNWLMRSAILIIQIVIILMLPIVGLFTWKYAEVKVIRAASPVLLGFIVLGAFFTYCTILVMYPIPSIISCTMRVWLREIGFSLAYGALMLKTWRISVIFRVRSAKAVKITDLDLMKRLGMIVGMFTALLVIRTLVSPPVSVVHYTADNNLKAWLCISDWWDHSFTIMELSFLVWGIRLCIVVRKAPSEFNESKFISLAIYNEFLLSLFLNISMLFLQSPPNPDLLYIIFFCHVQLTMTLLLCLIFGSKAYMVFRGHGKGSSSDESRNATAKFITKSRGAQANKQPSLSAQNSTGTGLHASLVSNALLQDPSSGSRLPEDIQEEFQRFYSQLEDLKERNVKLGNRQLVDKIMAMQAAAVTLLSTVSDSNDTNGLHCPTPASAPPTTTVCPNESSFKASKTTPTPRLHHISEEESAAAASGKQVVTLYKSEVQSQELVIVPYPEVREELTEDLVKENPSTSCNVAVEWNEICSMVAVVRKPAEVPDSPISTDDEDGLEYMDVDDYEEEDEVGNSIRKTLLIPLEEGNIQNGAAAEASETIPGSIITASAPPSQEPGVCTEEKVQILEPPQSLSGTTGNQSLADTVGSPASAPTTSSSNRGSVKIILDLDDKSRFTEEITV